MRNRGLTMTTYLGVHRMIRKILDWYEKHDGLEILVMAFCMSTFALVIYTFLAEIVSRIFG